jgi:hypothetical protein
MRNVIRPLIMMLCALLFSFGSILAQASPPPLPPAQTIEQLPNNEFIVSIGGQEYRAITADHAREIKTKLLERDEFEKKIQAQDTALNLSLKDSQIAQLERDKNAEKAEKFRLLYENTQSALTLSQTLFRKPNRFQRILDNPYVSIGLRVGLPLTQMAYCRQN